MKKLFFLIFLLVSARVAISQKIIGGTEFIITSPNEKLLNNGASMFGASLRVYGVYFDISSSPNHVKDGVTRGSYLPNSTYQDEELTSVHIGYGFDISYYSSILWLDTAFITITPMIGVYWHKTYYASYYRYNWGWTRPNPYYNVTDYTEIDFGVKVNYTFPQVPLTIGVGIMRSGIQIGLGLSIPKSVKKLYN